MTPSPGRLLAIDHGRKVLGLAVCDSTGLLATPLGRLERGSRKEDFAAIAAILDEEHAVEIVVGLPLPPPGFDGYSQADTVRLWASRLAAAVDVPVRLWNEALSSEEAARLLWEAGLDGSGRHDEAAAAVILQSYLDSLREGLAVPPAVAPAQGE